MENHIEKNLIKFHVLQHILKYTAPIYLIHLVSIFSYFSSAYFISCLGKNQIAAFAVANTYFVFISVFMTATLSTVSLTLGKSGIRKPLKLVKHVIFNGFLLTLMLSAFGTVLLWNGMHILILLGQPFDLALCTTQYFHYAALSITPFLLNSLISQICIGLGKPALNRTQCWIRLPLMIGLSYLLILEKKQGIAGASLALLLTNLLILPVTFFLLRASDIGIFLYLKTLKPGCWSRIRQLLNSGVYIGFQFSGELGAVLFFLFLMGHFGKDALVSTQITSQYSIFLLIGSLSVSQGLSNSISEYVGYTKELSVQSYTNTACYFLLLIITLWSLFYLLIPVQLMSIFINVTDADNTQLIQLTKSMLIASIPILFMDGLRNILTGSLRGLGNTRTPMIIDILGLWLAGLPLSYFFGFTMGYGPVGLRVGFMLGYFVSAMNLLIFYRKIIADKFQTSAVCKKQVSE